jgi:hypothetical protein
MAAPKKPAAKVVPVRVSRVVDFQCSKQLKLMRGSMTKAQFNIMLKNEKAFQLKKKQKTGSSKNED